MSYFKDMTPYTYSLGFMQSNTRNPPIDGLVNIGWLDPATAPFETGPMLLGLIEKLERLCATRQINMTRGWYWCPLCPSGILGRLSGSAEIFVPNPDGGGFMCPELIGHYVRVHHYLPPEVFIRALAAMEES